MNYYKRHWDETTGDELTNSWGTSRYYFETDNDNNVVRQIQLFENGKALKYDTEYLDDDFGGLSDQPLDIEEFEEFKTTHSDFENIWQQTNRP